LENVGKQRKWLIPVLVVLSGAASIATAADADALPAKKFRNCYEMKRGGYPLGVARNRRLAGKMPIFVSRSVYSKNKALDTDKDGLVCENEGDQALFSSTTSIPSVPAAPSNLRLLLSEPFNDTASITWTDNASNEEVYYVSNVDPATLGSTPLDQIWARLTPNSTYLGVRKFENGVTYCYWVMAWNTHGSSPWVGPVCSNPEITTTTTSTTSTTSTTTTTTTTTTVAPRSTSTSTYVPPISGGIRSSYNWLGCYFKGQKMWGKVYVTNYSFDADVKVYQTSYSFDADLKVYNARYSFDANSCGKWYITRYSFDADFKVYFTRYSFDADFKIYVTPYSFDAGR
jgi:hypothetical protein